MAILVILTLQKPAAALPMCLRAARALSWIRCAARTGPSRGRKARSITTLSYQHEAAPAPQLGLWAGFPGLRERERCASDVRWHRIAPARKELRNGSNKSEREPTSGRSTDYGSGHPVQAFHDIGRTFS
jgi:hypothetical protein